MDLSHGFAVVLNIAVHTEPTDEELSFRVFRQRKPSGVALPSINHYLFGASNRSFII